MIEDGTDPPEKLERICKLRRYAVVGLLVQRVNKLLKAVAQRMQAYLSYLYCVVRMFVESLLRVPDAEGWRHLLGSGKHAYRRVVPTLNPRDSRTLARVVRSIDDDFNDRTRSGAAYSLAS